jgi:hypothetical protein
VRKFAVEMFVADPLVSAEQANLVRNHLTDETGQGIGANVLDNASNDTALAANRASNRCLARADTASAATTAALIPMAVFGQSADKCFVNLNNTAKLGLGSLTQTSADAMAHVPSRPIGAGANGTMNLKGRNSFFAGQHHVDDAKPSSEGIICIFKNSADQMGKAIASREAIRAFPFPFHGPEVIDPLSAATGASDAFWPAPLNEIGATSIFVREPFLEFPDCHLIDGFWLFPAGHLRPPLAIGGH